ncbi:hypothetical protein WAI453_008119 [Rhynchosporium graminicola]|uniref:Uncharacterized protein n=1 Tax=Rhynchosporium graminicola TaxID=2792576 RepID=A0A1E1LTD0_9HELO|nr:uncharacterized protein RCO7_00677 [Rhynchosporium commune]
MIDETIAHLLPQNKLLAGEMSNTIFWILAILLALLLLTTCASCTIKELLADHISSFARNRNSECEQSSETTREDGEKGAGEEGVVVLKTFRDVYGRCGVKDVDDVLVLEPQSESECEGDVDEQEALERQVEWKRAYAGYMKPTCETDEEGGGK